MIEISPYNYFISGDDVLEAQGKIVRDTGINAEVQTLNLSAGAPMTAYCLKGASQFQKAVAELQEVYPSARIEVVSAVATHGRNDVANIGGLATSNAWLLVNDKVAVHPLMVRILARLGKVRNLNQEFSQNGILADIL